MDFALNEEQRGWQMKARQFATEEIRPISLARDRIADPRATFDWEIIRKGSRLGFRTAAVARSAGTGGRSLRTVTHTSSRAICASRVSAIASAIASMRW